MLMTGWGRIFCLAFLCLPALGQTFHVTHRSTSGEGYLLLDQNLIVTYQVNASGLSDSVVPKLVPVNAGQASGLSATWLGTSATTNLSNLQFAIHLYDEVALCGEEVAFDLYFESPGFPNAIKATTAQSTLTRFSTSVGQGAVLDLLVSGTTEIWNPISGVSSESLYKRNIPPGTLEDPQNRIYLYTDYNLNGWDPDVAFIYMLFAISPDCYINFSDHVYGETRYVPEVFDATGSGDPVPINIDVLGGSGSSYTTPAINVFDVTSVRIPNCSNQAVPDVLDYTPNHNYELAYFYGGNLGVILRDYRLYLGRDSGCFPLSFSFGSAPSSNFSVVDFSTTQSGDLDGRLDVPSEWGSSTLLDADFRVSWFLRGDGYLFPLQGESRDLLLETSLPSTVRDGVYALEARVRNIDTDDIVSTSSAEIMVVGCLESGDLLAQLLQELVPNWPQADALLNAVGLVNRTCEPL